MEVAEKPQEVGLYIDPLTFGKAPEKQLHHEINKKADDQRKADQERMAKNRESKMKSSQD